MKENIETNARASGYDLHMLARGGEHSRWVCLSCREQFILLGREHRVIFDPDSEKPKEHTHPHKWPRCPSPVDDPHFFCTDDNCERWGPET
jgi:hypothetical protein